MSGYTLLSLYLLRRRVLCEFQNGGARWVPTLLRKISIVFPCAESFFEEEDMDVSRMKLGGAFVLAAVLLVLLDAPSATEGELMWYATCCRSSSARENSGRLCRCV